MKKKKKSRLEYIQTKIRPTKTKGKETTQIKEGGHDRYSLKWAGLKRRAHVLSTVKVRSPLVIYNNNTHKYLK